jgi:hypothetical protein
VLVDTDTETDVVVKIEVDSTVARGRGSGSSAGVKWYSGKPDLAFNILISSQNALIVDTPSLPDAVCVIAMTLRYVFA